LVKALETIVVNDSRALGGCGMCGGYVAGIVNAVRLKTILNSKALSDSGNVINEIDGAKHDFVKYADRPALHDRSMVPN